MVLLRRKKAPRIVELPESPQKVFAPKANTAPKAVVMPPPHVAASSGEEWADSGGEEKNEEDDEYANGEGELKEADASNKSKMARRRNAKVGKKKKKKTAAAVSASVGAENAEVQAARKHKKRALEKREKERLATG